MGVLDCRICFIVVIRFSCSTAQLASSSTVWCRTCDLGHASCSSPLIPLRKHLWSVPSSMLASVDSNRKVFQNSVTVSFPCFSRSILFRAVPSASGSPNCILRTSSSAWYVSHVLSFFPSAYGVNHRAAASRSSVSVNVIFV